MPNKPQNTALFTRAVNLLQEAREKVVRTVNLTMVYTYFEIGRMIVDEEQHGEDRAQYGKHLLSELSKVLTKEFGKGFSVSNLQQMRNFYAVYQNQQTLSVKSDNTQNEIAQTGSEEFSLSWSHYLKLMRIEDENERRIMEEMRRDEDRLRIMEEFRHDEERLRYLMMHEELIEADRRLLR